ncbi:hypothetical protein C8R46DRAFT_1274457, partial [Mycena filopes]
LQGVPVEVWDFIFHLVCDEELLDDFSFLTYVDAKERIRLAHPDFAAVIDGCVNMWNHFLVNCSTPPDFVRDSVANVCGSKLHVNIMLDPEGIYDLCFVPKEFEPSHDECVINAIECLKHIVHTVPNWRCLCVWCSTPALLMAFVEVLGNVPAPNLENLIFTCPPTPGSPNRCDLTLSDPPALFGRSMPKLRKLRIVAAALPWGDDAYFANLDHLEVRNTPRLAWPRADKFISSLVASTHLRVLMLAGGGVYFTTDSPPEPFVLPALEILHVVFLPDTKWVLAVLAAGTFPLLTAMFCTDFTRFAWSVAFDMAVFPQLTSLTISGPATTTDHIRLLLEHLSSLTFLDLSDTNSPYFAQLYSRPLLCPSLKHLSLRGKSIARISTYVIARSLVDSYKLEAVEHFHELTYPLTYVATALLGELRRRLTSFYVRPEFDASTAPVETYYD